MYDVPEFYGISMLRSLVEINVGACDQGRMETDVGTHRERHQPSNGKKLFGTLFAKERFA